MEIYVSKDGAQTGPFPMEEVQKMISEGQYSSTDYGWHTGLKDWISLQEMMDPKLKVPPHMRPDVRRGGLELVNMYGGDQSKISFGIRIKRKILQHAFFGIYMILIMLFCCFTGILADIALPLIWICPVILAIICGNHITRKWWEQIVNAYQKAADELPATDQK